ncbi:SDR family oxidoreductase [Arthrobacter sp. RHLT1-20]
MTALQEGERKAGLRPNPSSTGVPALTTNRNVILFGATGFIGRWATKELLDQGASVTAPLRDSKAAGTLEGWFRNHGTSTENLQFIPVDFHAKDLGINDRSLPFEGHKSPCDVINATGAYAFGMTKTEATRANVESAEAIVRFAARLPALRRLVHVSGYRVGGQDPTTLPWSHAKLRRLYSRLGAYEASKVEGDAVVQAAAERLNLPLTVVNPATVTGHSITGETNQILGLASTLQQLWRGELRAMAGGPSTFVPIVPVDYLARFLALVPTVHGTEGKSYWVLDDNTPNLPDLLALLGSHYQVRVPRLRIPVAIVKMLPARLSGVEPETLSFLSSDRYPTRTALELAQQSGHEFPDTITSLKRWADYLAVHHFRTQL